MSFYSKSLGRYLANSEMTDDELQSARANARHTAMNALGHDKNRRGRAQAREYEKELKRRNLEIDNSIKGIFNGSGSY